MNRLNLLSIIVTTIVLLHSTRSSAQEEKKSIKLSLSYSQINNQSPELIATAKSKIGKRFEPVEGLVVNFYLGEQSQQGLLGKAKANKKGIASVELPDTIASKLDSLSPFKFIAFVEESKEFDEQLKEIEITKARIDLTVTEVDSTRKVNAKLLALKEGKWIETPEAEIKLFVRRQASDLLMGEGALTTNATGEVSSVFSFKTPLPGDVKGNIIIGAKMEDNDVYGTVIALKFANWGTQQKPDGSFFERSLWAARDKTPIWLLVVPNTIIAIVWGLIFYLFYFIFKIRKIGLEQ